MATDTRKRKIRRVGATTGYKRNDEHWNYVLDLAELTCEYAGTLRALHSIPQITEMVNHKFRESYHPKTIRNWIFEATETEEAPKEEVE